MPMPWWLPSFLTTQRTSPATSTASGCVGSWKRSCTVAPSSSGVDSVEEEPARARCSRSGTCASSRPPRPRRPAGVRNGGRFVESARPRRAVLLRGGGCQVVRHHHTLEPCPGFQPRIPVPVRLSLTWARRRAGPSGTVTGSRPEERWNHWAKFSGIARRDSRDVLGRRPRLVVVRRLEGPVPALGLLRPVTVARDDRQRRPDPRPCPASG